MRTARPILFSTPMIRALLDGRKSMTRRIVKPQPFLDAMGNFCSPGKKGQHSCWGQRIDGAPCTRDFVKSRCPYGVPGDLLWVRETFFEGWLSRDGVITDWGQGDFHYRATEPDIEGIDDGDGYSKRNADGSIKSPWKPSIHMPRRASRLTLEITDVRVERLQDISEEDAKAEGIARLPNGQWHWHNFDVPGQHGYHTPTGAYDALWGDINGLASWPSNPWVWVLTFAVHHANVDAVLAQRAEVAV